MPLPLLTLRQDLTTELGDGFARVTTGLGTTTKAYDTTRLPEEEDGLLEKWWYKAISGTAANIGQVRRIKNFTKSIGELELVTAMPAVIASGDGYEVHRRFHPDLKDRFIKRALPLIWPSVYHAREDRTIVTVDDTYVYTLPSTVWEKPSRILLEQTDGQLRLASPLMHWRTRRQGSVLQVEFDSALPAGRMLRIEHMGVLSEPVNDSDTTEIEARQEPILLAQAAVLLYKNEWGRATGRDKEPLAQDVGFWESELELRKRKLGMTPLKPQIHTPSYIR